MQAQGKSGNMAVLALVATLLLGVSTLAMGESDAARAIRASAATVPTNIPGIYTYAEPPKGFNPVAATDEELATYGFPPRPDKQANPDQYTRWERHMRAAKIRWNGELRAVPGGGQLRPAGSSALPEAVQAETSGPKRILTNNASGVVVTSGQKTFTKNSILQVEADITVPRVQAPFDNTVSCTGEGYFAIAAAGIDGFVFNTGNGYGFDPQLEGGLFEQLACSGDLYYFAVVGWQGDYNVAFEVNPGDVVEAAPYTIGGAQSGVLVVDETTLTYAPYSVTTSGMIGATASWMVERMGPLGNTINIAFGDGFAYTETGTHYYPGSQATSTEVLTMTDDAGDQDIETVTQGSTGLEGLEGLWFETAGCAYNGGCTP
jgi:hypothetical protein